MQQVINVLRGLGKVLHVRKDDVRRQQLPRRWVDLIHHLNEQERMQKEAEAARRQALPPRRRSSRKA